MGLKITGIVTRDELKNAPGLPNEAALAKGPIAVIECIQDIPCNPCEKACPFGAITVGKPITNLPQIDEEKCTGCGVCIAFCPGLAIFKIHKNYTGDTALVEFPYEYLPLPAEGDIVPCGDRGGQYISKGKVQKIKNPKKYDGTTVITVEVPKEFFMEVRTICRMEAKQVE